MRTFSIYNNYSNDNRERREALEKIIQSNGFQTGKNGNFLFVIGGDGTFLKAIDKNQKNNPIFIGINTGNLGFLSEFSFDDVQQILKLIKTKKFAIEHLKIYEALVETKDEIKRFSFVNDFVIKELDSAIHLELSINEKSAAKFSGDGIIVSTKLGSTAYNMSAGGPILFDCEDLISITPLSPIQNKIYDSFSNPIVTKDTNEILFKPYFKKGRAIRLISDGLRIKVSDIRSISIKKTPFKVRMLRSHNFAAENNIIEKIMNK